MNKIKAKISGINKRQLYFRFSTFVLGTFAAYYPLV